jgi:hypothetical protein
MTRGFNSIKGIARGAMGFGRGAGRLMGRHPFLTGYVGGMAATGAAIGLGGGRRQGMMTKSGERVGQGLYSSRRRGFGATPPGYQTPDDYEGGAWWANR